MKAIKLFAAAVIAVIPSACDSKSKEADIPKFEVAAETARSLNAGSVVGTYGRDGALAWYGIPYAKPPIGELRWRAPRKPEPWEGELEATYPYNRCPQFTSAMEPGQNEGDLAGDEDCLYLNVWAPSSNTNTKRPVMLWIHGGANVWGFAGQYEMGRLAQQEDVVVVGINYRLGMMGWFAHPSIIATAENELDKAANFATLDQIAALQWVQENISAFGGDPDNVTIFGQSAGGFNVAALLSSPLSDGLFHRAIVQSGGFRSTSYKEAVTGPDDPSARRRGASTSEFIGRLVELEKLPALEQLSDAELASRLRSMSFAEIYETYSKLPIGIEVAGAANPVDISDDGVVIPKGGIQSALEKAGGLHDVPLMIGTTKDEFKGLAFLDKEMVGNFMNIAFWPKNKDEYVASGYYPNAVWAYNGVEAIAEKWSKNQESPVFTYRFDWDEQGKKLTTDISLLVGASHSIEIPFVIGGFDDAVGDPLGIFFHKKNKADRELLSSRMMEYWAEFARTGNPDKGTSNSLPEWTAWSPGKETKRLFLLDTDVEGGPRLTNEVPTTDELFNAFVDDERFRTVEARCRTVGFILDIVNIVGGQTSPWQEFENRNCPKDPTNSQ